MSETSAQTQTPVGASADKLQWAERVLTDILRLMEVPARLDVKDAPPTPLDKGSAGISVAIMLESGDAPAPAGKRSSLSESLQFLANKIVNRAGTSERRWISVAIGGHPEPKVPGAQKKPERSDASPAPAGEGSAGAPAASRAQAGRSGAPAGAGAAPPPPKPERAAQGGRARGAAASQGAASARVDEGKLEVSPEPVLSTLAQGLAQRATTFGRYYAVVGLSVEDRARMLQSCPKSPDVTVSVEGEGRARRLVFTPAKPVPMPKRAFPDLPDFDEDEEDTEE